MEQNSVIVHVDKTVVKVTGLNIAGLNINQLEKVLLDKLKSVVRIIGVTGQSIEMDVYGIAEEDIQKVYSLYSAYEDVIERVKIATVADIREKDYTLAINNYIEKKEQAMIPPEEVRKQYFEAYEAMLRAEEKMKRLLLDGGYVSE